MVQGCQAEVERRKLPELAGQDRVPTFRLKLNQAAWAPVVDRGSGGVEARDCDAIVEENRTRGRAGYLLERNDVVARLHVGDALTNRLDNTSTLMTQDDGEGSLGVLAGQGVGICVADSSVVDLNTDFVCSWGQDFDVFDGQVLAGLPGNGGL